MELVVDNDNKTAKRTLAQKAKHIISPDPEAILVLDSQAVTDLLSQHFWDHNRWLDKYRYCEVEFFMDKTVHLIFSNQRREEP